MAERPLGITIIAILGFIGAVLLVIGGLFLLFVGTALMEILEGTTGLFGGLLGTAAGAIVLIIGIVQFVISYGLWKLKKWALYIEFILLLLGIVNSIIMMAYIGDLTQIVAIIISAIILYYLYSKRKVFS